MDDTGDEAAMKKLIYRLASLGLSVVSGMLGGMGLPPGLF